MKSINYNKNNTNTINQWVCSREKISKIYNNYLNLQNGRERRQIKETKRKRERNGNKRTDTEEIQRLMRTYIINICFIKTENVKEAVNFLNTNIYQR